MIRNALSLFSALVLSSPAVAAPAAPITQYASPEAVFAVNSWLVPTDTGVVVIDTQFTVTEADKLAAAVAAGKRPLRAIVITHPHPDHYNGTCRLLKLADVPVYATHSTIDAIRATEAAKRAQWKPTYGIEYPDETCLPDHAVPDSGEITVDGLLLRIRNYGAGEATTESVVHVPHLNAVFVGDLIYTQVHPWLAEGRSAQWLTQLDRLMQDVMPGSTVYAGHGSSGTVAVISAQRRYIKQFRAATRRRLQGGVLSKAATEDLVKEFTTQYPRWPLQMLLPINASAIAAELSAQGTP